MNKMKMKTIERDMFKGKIENGKFTAIYRNNAEDSVPISLVMLSQNEVITDSSNKDFCNEINAIRKGIALENVIPINLNLLVENENSDMVFANNNAEAMRITSAGDLSIGSTTTDEQLHVKGRRGLTRPAGGHRVIEFYTNITASTSAADLFTATCSNAHSSFYYEIIVNGSDWSGHSAARTIKRGCHVPNTTYTEHSVVESSGPHANDITYSYSRSSNTFTGKLTLDTGGVGLNCYVKLVGMITSYTVAGTE